MCELDEKVWGWVLEWKPERGVHTVFRIGDIDIPGNIEDASAVVEGIKQGRVWEKRGGDTEKTIFPW